MNGRIPRTGLCLEAKVPFPPPKKSCKGHRQGPLGWQTWVSRQQKGQLLQVGNHGNKSLPHIQSTARGRFRLWHRPAPAPRPESSPLTPCAWTAKISPVGLYILS